MAELVSVPCSKGKLQVLQEGVLQLLGVFNKVAWHVYCRDVTRFTTTPGSMGSVNVTIVTTQGVYTADMVTKANFAKVEAFFPHLATQSITGRQWYHDVRTLTHVGEYTDARAMQKEVEAAAQYGWMPQDMAARVVRHKGKTTIIFIRTPGWLAQNK